MNEWEDYYKILGVSHDATNDEIKKAYRELAKRAHPDMGGSTEQMQKLNQIYDILGDEQLKRQYDALYDERLNKNNTEQSTQYNNRHTEPNSNQSEYKYIDILTIFIITLDSKVITKTIPKSEFDHSLYSYIYPDGTVYAVERKTNEGIIINRCLTKRDWQEVFEQRCLPFKDRVRKTFRDYPFLIQLIPYVLIGVVVIIMMISSAISGGSDSENNAPTQTHEPIRSTTVGQPLPSVTLPPELPLPATGEIIKWPSKSCEAPLEIKTSSDSGNYYVYLKDANGVFDNDISFFIRGGETLDMDIPFGSYRMYYCSGSKWYGPYYKFGKYTHYATSDEILEFTHDDEYAYGNTITLYDVLDGNLETETISEDEFPG